MIQTASSCLRQLSGIKPSYFVPRDNLLDEALIPCFSACDGVDCAIGYFSSASLAELAPGLATYLNNSSAPIRLVINPFLSDADIEAIETGLSAYSEFADRIFPEEEITEDLIARHALRCLSFLILKKRIEIKIAFMAKGIFHPKFWIFKDSEDRIVAHGSANFTSSGIRSNYEQVAISRSWSSADSAYLIREYENRFRDLWNNTEGFCRVISLPLAVEERLLKKYSDGATPQESELQALYQRARTAHEEEGLAPEIGGQTVTAKPKEFRIPENLKYETGPFEHQGKAVTAWCEAGFRGILEMATGSGKTIASMVGAFRLSEKKTPLLIVIAAPYVPLVEQWCDEIIPFGITPTNLTVASGPNDRAAKIKLVGRRLQLGTSKTEVLVVSHDTLCSPDFQEAIKKVFANKLLIADECHNLGRPEFIRKPPEFFDFRLGLSATPIRQYDEEGSEALLNYFGPVVFKFTLENAIGRCLVEYEYYVHTVDLSSEEMGSWRELTAKIRANAWRQENGKPDEFLGKLLRDRRVILELAGGKLDKLSSLLALENPKSLKHTLIYTTDKDPAQMEQVNRMLGSKNIRYHQLTQEETRNRKQVRQILNSFQSGHIQVLTAKRVLDEGVNIPEVSKAFILASTTVERQWIQRRGRLLRTCQTIGKTHSVIHDFLVLPPEWKKGLDQDTKSLVSSELKRALEFAKLSRNVGRPDGPMRVIDGLLDMVYG